MSQSAASSTFASFEYPWMWSLPRPRNPTQATRTVSLGLGVARRAAASTPAELMRKCLRFMGGSPDRQYTDKNVVTGYAFPDFSGTKSENAYPVTGFLLALEPAG